MVNYNGEYKLVSSEKFDEYMKTVGVGLIMRKAANAAYPVITVTTAADGRHWRLHQVTTFKTHDQEFDIGQEQEITTADGRKVKSIVTKDGDTLTEIQTGGGKTSTLVRTFTDDAIEMTVSCDDVVCKRVYKRQ